MARMTERRGGAELKAVIFDFDDTLIVEEATALAGLGEALSAVAGVGRPDAVDVVLACARRHWRASAHHELCLRLGIASWEGLWASFEGGHPCLAGMAQWAPEYRRVAWSDALVALGADPDARCCCRRPLHRSPAAGPSRDRLSDRCCAVRQGCVHGGADERPGRHPTSQAGPGRHRRTFDAIVI